MIYENRPKLIIPRTFLENVLDLAGIILFIASAGSLVIQWSSIPDTVPIHFNTAGEPDGWGSKNHLWILLVVGLITWILLTIIEKFPHIYNYLFLTAENAEQQYKNARLMINVLKNEILIFFVYMSWVSGQIANGNNNNLSLWDLPIFIIGITGTIAFFIVRSIKLK
jgi:uncharacterized membrane protein